MTFADIPQGVSVFIDANPFVYHFGPHPVYAPACTTFLERVNRREIQGFSCACVLSDVAHRLMNLEARAVFNWTSGAVTQKLKNNPTDVQKLSRFRQAILDIPSFGVQLLATLPGSVERATELSQQIGLLSGDALVVAMMQAHGLSHLASHDADFDRVPGITRYGPG
jgi:predicted nucleic acid-binding protein